MSEGNNHIKSYTAEDIQAYLEGRMNSVEMYALEHAALEDPFLSDAIEGYKTSGINALSSKVELNQALHDRIRNSPRRIFPFWLRIAAAVAIMAITITAITLVMNPGNKHDENLAIKQKSVVQVDSVTTPIEPDSGTVAYQEPAKSLKLLPGDVPIELKSKEKYRSLKAKEERLSQSRESEKNEEKDVSNHLSKAEVEPTPQSVASRSVSTARGIVIDSNKKPIAGATVKLDKQQVVTDNAGVFELKPTDTVMNIEVQSAGFATRNVSVNNDAEADTIILKPSNQALEEVVVVGYGFKKSRSKNSRKQMSNDSVAAPSIPWEKYNEYIVGKLDSSGLNTELKTEVVISFLVDAQGRLSKFRVEKPAPTEMINDFLIDQIKTGPQWQVQGGKSARGTVRIKPEREN